MRESPFQLEELRSVLSQNLKDLGLPRGRDRIRVAHFLSRADLLDNPSNFSLLAILLDLGVEIDLYAPDFPDCRGEVMGEFRTFRAEYGKKWIAKNVLGARWLRYSLLSGTCEDPMAVVGLLSRLYSIPCITLADEIYSGSYGGNRSTRWKRLARSGMRRSALTIVNSVERVSLQREYAGLRPDQPIAVMPNCYPGTLAAANRDEVRKKHALPPTAIVICFSGVYSYHTGGEWLAAILKYCPEYHVWAQVNSQDRLAKALLRYSAGADRLVLDEEPTGWIYPWRSAVAADLGIVVYLQDAPQFQNMGLASNRLCMFLSAGVPVIVSRQPSFEFVEEWGCGVLVDSIDELVHELNRVRERLPEMRINARRCAAEYINAPKKVLALREQVGGLVQSI